MRKWSELEPIQRLAILIKDYVLEQNISMNRFAEMCVDPSDPDPARAPVSAYTLSKIMETLNEDAPTMEPRFSTLRKIARAMNYSTRELFTSMGLIEEHPALTEYSEYIRRVIYVMEHMPPDLQGHAARIVRALAAEE